MPIATARPCAVSVIRFVCIAFLVMSACAEASLETIETAQANGERQTTTTSTTPDFQVPELASPWGLEPDLVVVAGPAGIELYSPGTGDVEALSRQPVANALAGVAWGFVVHPADGSEEPRTSTAPVWWFESESSEPSLMFQPPTNPESGDPFEIEVYSIIEVDGEMGAIIRIHAFQNDDLWVHQSLTGGPSREIGLMSGGEVEVGCVAYDGVALYLASSAHSAFIEKRTLDGVHTPYLPDLEEGWPSATSCVAMLPNGGVLGLVQSWDETGRHPPAQLLVASPEGTVGRSIELPEAITGAIGLDVSSIGDLLLIAIDGRLWLLPDLTSSDAVELPVGGLQASFVD